MGAQTYDALALIDKAIALQKGGLDAAKTAEVLRGLTLESPRGRITIDAQTREVHQSMYVQRAEHGDGRYFNAEIAAFAPRV
jgi:branched-chain amino acid transport system substrate-binding protein